MITAVKRPGESNIYTQPTIRQNKKIMLFGEDNNKHLFPLMRDRDIGIASKYQDIVMESVYMVGCSTMTMTNRLRVPR